MAAIIRRRRLGEPWRENGGGDDQITTTSTTTTTTTTNNNTTPRTTATSSRTSKHFLLFQFHLVFLLLLLFCLTLLSPAAVLVRAAEGDEGGATKAPTPVPVTQKVTQKPAGEQEGEGEGEGGEVTDGTETAYESYTDDTKFVDGVNGWDFMGSWAKYDLSLLGEEERPLPLIPDAEDQGVFICQTSTITSTLTKLFPTLHNATFDITYYASAEGGELVMTGEVVAEDGTKATLFNQSASGEGDTGHAEGTWGTDTYTLPALAAAGPFTLKLGVRHSEQGIWATAEMKVEGKTGPAIPPTTTTAPPIPPPVNVTTNATNGNETTTADPTTGDTNTTSTTTSTTTPVPTTTEETDALAGLEGVAQAIWDAFYVFLALFCACLVALIALIIHGRCKEDEPPPAVATYNPRTASYRMDKVYDNPSYDNNSV